MPPVRAQRYAASGMVVKAVRQTVCHAGARRVKPHVVTSLTKHAQQPQKAKQVRASGAGCAGVRRRTVWNTSAAMSRAVACQVPPAPPPKPPRPAPPRKRQTTPTTRNAGCVQEEVRRGNRQPPRTDRQNRPAQTSTPAHRLCPRETGFRRMSHRCRRSRAPRQCRKPRHAQREKAAPRRTGRWRAAV